MDGNAAFRKWFARFLVEREDKIAALSTSQKVVHYRLENDFLRDEKNNLSAALRELLEAEDDMNRGTDSAKVRRVNIARIKGWEAIRGNRHTGTDSALAKK